MNKYGKRLFSFRDPRAPQWALFILGLALLCAGGLLLLIFAVEGSLGRSDADAIGAMALMAVCVFGGIVCALLGLRSLIQSPEWHLTATHAFRTRGSRVIRVITLRDKPAPKVTRNVRYGQTVSVLVELGDSAIVAPTTDVAQAIVDIWHKAAGR